MRHLPHRRAPRPVRRARQEGGLRRLPPGGLLRAGELRPPARVLVPPHGRAREGGVRGMPPPRPLRSGSLQTAAERLRFLPRGSPFRAVRARPQDDRLRALPRHCRLEADRVRAPAAVHPFRPRRKAPGRRMLRLPSRGGGRRRGPRAPVPRPPHHLRGVPRGRPPRRVPGARPMSVLLLLIAASAPAPTPRSPPLRASMDTRCEACHSVDGWRRVTFDHSRTGFPLEGRHVSASCRACHGPSQDFTAPVATSCAACHRDVHLGEFGNRCSSCHDPSSWATSFGPDAHRLTNFPLTGRHAAIPCEECHLNQRDRRFTRATVDCYTCHQADYARTAGTAIDHLRAGFGTDCKSCHFPTRFKGATFPAHNSCFQITGAPTPESAASTATPAWPPSPRPAAAPPTALTACAATLAATRPSPTPTWADSSARTAS